MTWPDKEQRQGYVELLITLNSEMKSVHEKIESIALKLDRMNGMGQELGLLKKLIFGAWGTIGTVIGWLYFKK